MGNATINGIVEISTFFDKEAASYDRVLEGNAGVRFVNAVEKNIVRNWVSCFEGREVLDVGIGTGRVARIIVQNGFSVTGVDRSLGMIKNMKSGPRENGIKMMVGDGQRLPLKSNSVDNISCMRVFKYFEDANTALGEFYRVLAHKGYAIVQVANKTSYQYLLTVFKSVGNRTYNNCLRLHTYGEMMKLFRENGFMVRDSAVTVRIPFFIYAKVKGGVGLAFLKRLERLTGLVLPKRFMARDYLFLVQKT